MPSFFIYIAFFFTDHKLPAIFVLFIFVYDKVTTKYIKNEMTFLKFYCTFFPRKNNGVRYLATRV